MGATKAGILGGVLITAIVAAACGRSPSPTAVPDAEAGGPASSDGAESGPSGEQPDVDGDGSTAELDALLPRPPAPSPDDPRACAPPTVPAPSVVAEPDRPCKEERSNGTTTYRYEATGRVIYRAVHTDGGADTTYTSRDDGDVRIETIAEKGRVKARDVTRLRDGKPVEAEHYEAGDDGVLVLRGHSRWLYNAGGKLRFVVTERDGRSRKITRHAYDSKGRPYFVDVNTHWLESTTLFNLSFMSRSFYENGNQAHEVRSCGETGGAPCATFEWRWEPCGNLAYESFRPGNYRHQSHTDWTWGHGGGPAARHRKWNTTSQFFDTTETYRLDASGRAVSGTVVTAVPPGYPEQPRQEATYAYDDAGRLIEAALDGKIVFQARYDAAGRLIERTTSGSTVRWTYDGCGR